MFLSLSVCVRETVCLSVCVHESVCLSVCLSVFMSLSACLRVVCKTEGVVCDAIVLDSLDMSCYNVSAAKLCTTATRWTWCVYRTCVCFFISSIVQRGLVAVITAGPPSLFFFLSLSSRAENVLRSLVQSWGWRCGRQLTKLLTQCPLQLSLTRRYNYVRDK